MNAPVAKPETAIAVIDPKSYAAWDPLLDLFEGGTQIRRHFIEGVR